MKIQITRVESDAFTEVIELARQNSKTLGFLPQGAIENYARQGQLLTAVDENGHVMGYLLYATNRKEVLAYIVHLCVSEEYRGRGVASALFATLRTSTESALRGVRVRCRQDYDANDVWPKLGFQPRSERRGRGKKESTLVVWWYDYGHRTLFSISDLPGESTKLQAVIDANVFFQLQEPQSEETGQSHALKADWLEETTQICVTPEIYNEIHRGTDRQQRKKSRSFIGHFRMLEPSNSSYESAIEVLKPAFPLLMSDRDKSDLYQLAWTAAAGVNFFLTHDRDLLARADNVYERTGITITEPSHFVVHQDSLARESEYQPARLAGSGLCEFRVSTSDAKEVGQQFRRSAGEKKSEFNTLLSRCLAEPRAIDTKVVCAREARLGLYSIERREGDVLDIPLLRLAESPLASTLARYIIQWAVLLAHSERRLLTRVTDPHLSGCILSALIEFGFYRSDGAWSKTSPEFVGTSREFQAWLNTGSERCSEVGSNPQLIAQLVQTCLKGKRNEALMSLEKNLWPAKFTDVEMPCFIVPIKPVWAMNLFDSDISSRDLIGGDPNLILNAENAYYRSCRPKILEAPSRVLWYVSSGKGQGAQLSAIRACSYIEEVVIDRPSVLYKKFRRLGVYKWEDIAAVAHGNTAEPIMAFRFSRTQQFNQAVSYDDINDIFKDESGKAFNPVAPTKIPSDRFFRLYRLGTKQTTRR